MQADSDELIGSPPEDLTVGNNHAVLDLLPNKSADMYNKKYEEFMKWCSDKNVHNYSENVFLDYMSEKAKTHKSSTLWSSYSMLKATFLIKRNIDISKFQNLIEFIKKQNVGYTPKKSSVFTREEINKFLLSAPDEHYLMWKLCVLFGVAGGCRMDELRNMTIDDVDDRGGDTLIVTLPKSRTGRRRTFTVTNEICDGLNPADLYSKYRSLRPTHTPHKRLFIFYQRWKCSTQPIGIHNFGKIPSQIAAYLNLPNANSYTGHAFRRTSASLLVDTGSDVVTFKQQAGWKSMSVSQDLLAQGYMPTPSINMESPANDSAGLNDQHTFDLETVKIEPQLMDPEPFYPSSDEASTSNSSRKRMNTNISMREKEFELQQKRFKLEKEKLELEKMKFEVEKVEREARFQMEMKEREQKMQLVREQQNMVFSLMDAFIKNNFSMTMDV